MSEELKNFEYINIESVYFALITEVATAGVYAYTPTIPELIAKLAEVSSDVVTDTKKSWYGGQVLFQYNSEGDTTLKFKIPFLDALRLAKYQGKYYDTESGCFMDSGSADEKPYLAIGFSGVKSNKATRNFWYLKCQVDFGTEAMATATETKDAKNVEVTATCYPTLTLFTYPDTKKKPCKRVFGDSDNGKLDVSDWFTEVKTPENITLLTP